MRRTSTRIVVAVVAVATAALGLGGVAAAQTLDYTPEAISATPSVLVVGQTFTVSGTGWTAGATVTLTFESQPVGLGTVTVAADGTFTTQATTPNVALGTHTVRGTSGADEATTSVRVVAPGAGAGAGADDGGAGALPRTGSSSTLPLGRIGIALVAGGGLSAALARHRLRARAA